MRGDRKFGRVRAAGATLAALLLCAVSQAWCAPGTIRAAVYAGPGVAPVPDPVFLALAQSEQILAHPVSPEDVRSGRLEAEDALVMPGGFADAQSAALGAEGLAAVRRFVAEGGAYVGICAGAYLATAHPLPRAGNLELLNVTNIPPWERGAGPLRAAWPGEPGSFGMYYENGPVFGPAGRPDLPRATTVLEYRSGPGGSVGMEGFAAAVAGPYGRGRVVLLGPHPERTPGRAWMLARAIEWCVRRPYRGGLVRWSDVFGTPPPSAHGAGQESAPAAPLERSTPTGALRAGAPGLSPDLRDLFRPLAAAWPPLGGPYHQLANYFGVSVGPGGPASVQPRSDPLVLSARAPLVTSPLPHRSARPLRGDQ